MPGETLLPTLGRRVLHMTLVWTVLGAFVGIGCGPLHRGVLGVISGALAGVIVLAIFGVFCGLLGGRPRQMIAGTICGGLTMITLVILRGDALSLHQASVGLVIGSLTGSTCFVFLRAESWILVRTFGLLHRRPGSTDGGTVFPDAELGAGTMPPS
jgi:hypothetical protein